MITSLRLPFQFDPQSLKSDLARIHPHEWTPHYNERDYGGDWHGVALRSLDGDSRQLHAKQAGADAYLDTEVLRRCPYFQQVLAAFACALKSVRLLRLTSGSVIREHSDPFLGFEDGEVRIHIPIQTNPGVEFCVEGNRLQFEEGNCYYVNVSLPHRVTNRGREDRIHLVIDADVNEQVRTIFRQSDAVASSSPPRDLDANWLPISVHFQSDRPVADWVCFDSHRLTEPFFDDSVRAALRNPSTRASRHRAPLGERPGMTPSGFIFHMSRCGSTLIAQTLASVPRTLVISEADPIDSAIQTNNVEYVRRTVQALGQRRFDETHYFIKLDAWHVRNLALIREAFPQTPWIFVSRDPVEVLVSQLSRPGRLALPGAIDPEALGLSFHHVTTVSREEWCARVLANVCSAALEFTHDPQALFIDYRDLPGAIQGSIANHFSLALSSDELACMRSATQFDAKSPTRAFEPDSAAKQRAVTPAVHDLAARWLNPLYSRLQQLTTNVQTHLRIPPVHSALSLRDGSGAGTLCAHPGECAPR